MPPASTNSGLEELRAAHNLISQVPVSLSKNASLRTLDLGHNRIDKWIGLERLGKSLKSLMQLSLAGNPLCGSPTTATSEDKRNDGEEEGEYVVKLRSLFPGLKVRDGKRILMKKSHTYYESRVGEEAGSGAEDVSGPGGRGKPGRSSHGDGRAGLDAKSHGDGQRPLIEGEKKAGAKSPKSKSKSKGVGDGRGARGSGEFGAEVLEEGKGKDEADSKAARKLTRKAARAAVAELASEAERQAKVAALGKPDKKRAKKRQREAEEGTERRKRSPVETAGTASVASNGVEGRKKHRRQSEESAADSVVETAAGADDTLAASTPKATKTKKKKKTKADHEGTSTSSVGGSVGQRQEDPYSSSEELSVPGRGPARSARAASVPVAGGRESGVVSVVIKKRKSAKGASAKPWQGGAAPGRKEDGEKFSFDAILEARGEKGTIGLGSGISAWDT